MNKNYNFENYKTNKKYYKKNSKVIKDLQKEISDFFKIIKRKRKNENKIQKSWEKQVSLKETKHHKISKTIPNSQNHNESIYFLEVLKKKKK